ncbi:MAG: hypothetical protein U0234_30125 [Sandaracinus sp.]
MAKADVRATASAPSALEDRPTILAVGRGEAMLEAVALALDRHGVQVEIGDPDNAVQAVFVHAPDLVLLVGDAAADEGRATLEKLAATVATAVIPVAILSDDAGLDQRMQAARLGAVAVVPRSASADQMAQRIAEVARELPERKSEGATDLGEATLDEVVELFARRLRSGVLAVSASGGSERVVLRGDRPVTQAIEELVDRLRPLVTQSETVRWEFQQASTGKLAELKLDDEPSGTLDVAALFRDRRLVIVERSPARADDLVVALRQRGAHVVVIDGEGVGLAKARAIDPDVILVDVSGVGGWAGQAMQQIRADARLRWAALLVTRGEELWKANTPEPDIARLAAGMLPLVEPDESLTHRIRDGKGPIDVRLETTGPTRMLRAIARAGQTVHVTVRHRRATVEIDFAQGLVVGARGEAQTETPGGKPTKVEGAAALALCVGLATARVRIERREAPSVANVMSPVDDAIAAADREPSPITPSIPPPAGPASLHPGTGGSGPGSMRPPSGETDARVLVNQLENLLDRLRHTLPPGSLEVPSEVSAALAASTAAERKDATPSVAVKPNEPVIPAPARLPGAPPKPQPRKVTQMGIPVPAGLRPVPAPSTAASAKKTAAPPPAVDPAHIPVAPPSAIVPPPSAVPKEPTRPPPMALAKTQPAVVALPPPTVAKGRTDAEEPPTGRIVPLADMLEPPSDAEAAANVDALLSSELESIAPSEPPAPVVVAAAEPSPAAPPMDAMRPPLEATDQIALPPARDEDDDLALPTRRRGGAIALVGGAVVLALVGIGGAVAWRMGLFGSAPVVATPLEGPTPTSTLAIPVTTTAPPPSAPPTTTIAAPPSTTVAEVAAPPTTVAEVAPPTTVAEVAPPTTVAEAAPPPTTTVTPPPTTVAEVAPPPATVAEVAPPPATVADEGDEEEEDDGHEALSPTDPQYFVNRANFRRTHGDLQGAEADYLHVLRMSPNNARAMAGLARVHLARHDARTAATWARRLAEGHSPNAGNYVLLGDTLQASGDAAGARRAWERALQISPGYRDARRRLGR